MTSHRLWFYGAGEFGAESGGQGQKEIWERQLFLENSDHLLPTHKLLMINMYCLFSSRMR